MIYIDSLRVYYNQLIEKELFILFDGAYCSVSSMQNICYDKNHCGLFGLLDGIYVIINDDINEEYFKIFVKKIFGVLNPTIKHIDPITYDLY